MERSKREEQVIMHIAGGNLSVTVVSQESLTEHPGAAMWISAVTYILFLILISISLLLQYLVYTTKSNLTSANNQIFLQFQRKYYAVYFLALFGDWLQGPYVYKLYSHYGFNSYQIAMLYVVGFSASVLFGTGTGVLADHFGRKKMCMVFCLTYSLCCLTKLSPSFYILMIGRLLGGISTSLLFSVFEAWYVYEHIQTYDFPKEWISVTFSRATFWNGILAINAGIIANLSSEFLGFGPVSPFIIAIPCFLASCFIIYKAWGENYGQQSGSRQMCLEGLKVILSQRKILMLGIVQSLFESVMYIFVFLWTPVLDIGHPPLGMVFSVFMVCIMIGSSVYQLLLDYKMNSYQLLMTAVTLSAIAMVSCAVATSYQEVKLYLAYAGFLTIELAVGIYFPAIGFLKSQLIPESHRANIMNWFRVPLNVITSLVLLWLHNETTSNGNCIIFILCTLMMLLCIVIMLRLIKIASGKEIIVEHSGV